MKKKRKEKISSIIITTSTEDIQRFTRVKRHIPRLESLIITHHEIKLVVSSVYSCMGDTQPPR